MAAKPKSGASHARARVDADEGVRDCMRLMVEGLWVTGASHEAIAKKHGVSAVTVKDWATSASRVIRLSVSTDLEDIRARVMATLETVVAKAMTRQAATMAGEFYDNPDLRSAVSALAEQAKLLGLVVQKHEVALTEQQAKERYLELTGHPWGEAEPS